MSNSSRVNSNSKRKIVRFYCEKSFKSSKSENSSPNRISEKKIDLNEIFKKKFLFSLES